MTGGTGATDYFERVKRYNANLYRATDTAPKASEVPYFAPTTRTAGMNLGGGYETGDVNAIASRYGGVPYSAFAGGTSNVVPRFTTTPAPRIPLGSAGDTGSAGSIAPMGGSYSDSRFPGRVYKENGSMDFEKTYPELEGSPPGTRYDQPPMPKVSAPAKEGVAPPEGNALQRWMESGGTAHTFNKANTERGIRPRIDARARPDPKASSASADIRKKWGFGEDTMSLPY